MCTVQSVCEVRSSQSVVVTISASECGVRNFVLTLAVERNREKLPGRCECGDLPVKTLKNRSKMPRLEQSPPEDFRRVLREKALSHSLFYLKLGAGSAGAQAGRHSHSAAGRAPQTGRAARQTQPRVSELLRRFEPASPMQYLRPPRASSPCEDISSSDDDDRAAVRRRSRDLSDDSAVELDTRRRHSHPRDVTPPPDAMSPRRERTLIEAHVVELGRRGSEGCETRGRTVRTPSVVVSDYSDGIAVGATEEEVNWLRSRSLSADSACSSCSTLSSRDEEEFESPTMPKKMINAD